MNHAQPRAHGEADGSPHQPAQPVQYAQHMPPQYVQYPQNGQPPYVQHPQGAQPMFAQQHPHAVPRYTQRPRRRMHPLRVWGIVAVVLSVPLGLAGCFIMVIPYGLFIVGGGGNVDAFGEFAASFVAPGMTILVIGFLLLVLGIIGIIVGKSRIR